MNGANGWTLLDQVREPVDQDEIAPILLGAPIDKPLRWRWLARWEIRVRWTTRGDDDGNDAPPPPQWLLTGPEQALIAALEAALPATIEPDDRSSVRVGVDQLRQVLALAKRLPREPRRRAEGGP
jgi:hypothetical protein